MIKVKGLQSHNFHLVDFSPWPFLAGTSIFCIIFGNVMLINDFNNSFDIIIFGFFIILFVIFVWWRDIIRESSFIGNHTVKVQEGLSYGMILFIVSEIIFFFAFFWAFFHSSLAPSIEIGSVWPPKDIQVLSAFSVPLLNTIILLLSGCSATWAHYIIVAKNRNQTIIALAFTVFLGLFFLSFQVLEYIECNFHISDSVYGSTFFLLTGFHGFHVLVGTIFLAICFLRQTFYQLTSNHHFGLEAALWYWHFVDIVWAILFILVYFWGGI
jgi:cytochrome c oxidase subunit 3